MLKLGGDNMQVIGYRVSFYENGGQFNGLYVGSTCFKNKAKALAYAKQSTFTRYILTKIIVY